jgi:acyl carrier protein
VFHITFCRHFRAAAPIAPLKCLHSMLARPRNPMTDITSRIRGILEQHGRLSVDPGALADGADLYAAGLTSHASVSVMLGLEGEFGIEFPDSMLSRGVFSSVASIRSAIESLTGT